jgi:hypothetical protein
MTELEKLIMAVLSQLHAPFLSLPSDSLRTDQKENTTSLLVFSLGNDRPDFNNT